MSHITEIGSICLPWELAVKFLTSRYPFLFPTYSGTFVVNLGDCLQAWTKGLYRATRHRVRHSTKTDRYSIPLFFEPSQECIIEPIETDVTRNLTFTKVVKGIEMPFRFVDLSKSVLQKSHDWKKGEIK